MVFAGIPFLYFFLPAAVVAGIFARGKARAVTLLLFSLVFYAFGEPRYVVLMALTALVAWGCGLWAEARGGKLPLVLHCCVSVGFFIYFKYTDFLLGAVNGAFGTNLPLLRVALPVGISFYTFQSISYVADVTMGRIRAERNPINFGAYLTFFPQLIAGPIVRYEDIREQMLFGSPTWKNVSEGAVRFCVGLGKKVLIANVLAEISADAAAGEMSVALLWVLAVSGALTIYFDFSGYSDMAVGLGRMFGVELPENFRHPFASKSVAEFWRRWHITLGSWFRDYVYIPLGGSRCGVWKQIRNLLVVWALTGLWHGAAWTFVLWGLYFAAFLVLERFAAGVFRKFPPWLSHVYVVFVVVISFVLFGAESPAVFASQLRGMFGFAGLPLWNAETAWILRQYGVLLIVSAVCAFPLVPWILQKLRALPRWEAVCAYLQPVVMAALLLASTAFLAAGSFNPFLYFRF